MATFNLSVSPVRPEDNVTNRKLHITPAVGDEVLIVVDSDVNVIEGTLSDDEVPASCYLVDENSFGSSEPSAPFALIPPDEPPPPPPTPGNVPVKPTINSVVWGTNPNNFRSPCKKKGVYV